MSLATWTFSPKTTGPCYGALAYAESNYNSGEISVAKDRQEAKIVYQVDDNQKVAFINAVLGWTVYGVGYSLIRNPPEMHPQMINYYANSATAETVGQATPTVIGTHNNVGIWPMAKVSVTFSPPPYNVIPDGQGYEINRYVSRTYNYVMEYLTTRGLMKFYNDFLPQTEPGAPLINRPLDQAPGGVAMFLEKEMTWFQIPAFLNADGTTNFTPPNQDTVLLLGGQVNATTFDGHPPGTCVLVGYYPKLQNPTVSSGAYSWDITYRFLVRNYGAAGAGGPGGEVAGCNYIYNTFRSRWNLITSDGTATGGRIYASGELNNLFTIIGP